MIEIVRENNSKLTEGDLTRAGKSILYHGNLRGCIFDDGSEMQVANFKGFGSDAGYTVLLYDSDGNIVNDYYQKENSTYPRGVENWIESIIKNGYSSYKEFMKDEKPDYYKYYFGRDNIENDNDDRDPTVSKERTSYIELDAGYSARDRIEDLCDKYGVDFTTYPDYCYAHADDLYYDNQDKFNEFCDRLEEIVNKDGGYVKYY